MHSSDITHHTSDITKNSNFQHPFFMSRIEFSSSEELEPKCVLHADCWSRSLILTKAIRAKN